MKAGFFTNLFFIFLIGCLLSFPANAQQILSVCPLGQGFWSDSQNQERCIPCPPIGMFDTSKTYGLKLQRGCILPKAGIYTTVQDFTTLKIAEEYSIACEKKLTELESFHRAIQEKLMGMGKDVDQIKSDKLALVKANQELIFENLDMKYSKRVWIVLTITFGLVATGELVYILTR